MIFGAAFNLETATVNLTEYGAGLTADWVPASPMNGTFTVSIPSECGGAPGYFQGWLDLVCNGSAVLEITVTGEGCRFYTLPTVQAYIIRNGGIVAGGLDMHGPGGSHTPPPCTSAALVGTDTVQLPVVCGDTLSLIITDNFHAYCPALSIAVEVTVKPPCTVT